MRLPLGKMVCLCAHTVTRNVNFKNKWLQTMCEIKMPLVYYRQVRSIGNCIVSVEAKRSHVSVGCCSNVGKNMEKKILIIGSGAAGFAAASKLMANGFENVVILEAEDRIGGRVNTISYGANVLDMGAQWCHGEEGNVVYEMAKDKDLLSSNVPRYEEYNFVRSNGEAIPTQITDKLMEMAWSIIERPNGREEKKAHEGSFGNYVAERYYKALRSDQFNVIEPSVGREAFNWLHQFRNMYVACDSWYEVSCRDYIEYWDCPGDLLLDWKDKGYKTVFDLLQNKIPAGSPNVLDIESRVLLNKEVSKIIYDQSKTSADRIRVKCADGSEYFCDHLICTVSLGVLKKRHWGLFEPVLPQPKIDSIESIGFGTVDKIYVEFTNPFWDADWEGVSFLWKTEQLKEIHEDPVNGEWMKDTIGFYTVSAQPNILCGWLSGKAARIMEQVSEEEFKAGVERILKMFITEWKDAEVKNIFRSQWSSNPHFRGSYTYYTLHADAVGASTSILAEPILDRDSKPLIQFAGEATSEHYYSTVHGAVQTGWRESQRLIDTYKQ